MHEYFLCLFASLIVIYYVLDWVLVKSPQFFVYFTAFSLLSVGLISLYVYRLA